MRDEGVTPHVGVSTQRGVILVSLESHILLGGRGFGFGRVNGSGGTFLLPHDNAQTAGERNKPYTKPPHARVLLAKFVQDFSNEEKDTRLRRPLLRVP